MANFDFKETFLNPIFKGNPMSVLVLGICSSLAVTVQLNDDTDTVRNGVSEQ